MIFSRRRGSGQGDEPGTGRAAGTARSAAENGTTDAPGAGDSPAPARAVPPVAGEAGAGAPADGQEAVVLRRVPPEPGPYDAADAPKAGEALDLGALRIPVVEGVEVRVQADQEGHVQQVVLITGESALQLGVFAAPRTEPIWDEIRSELRAQLRSDGFTSQETAGEYGPELRAKVRTPEGPLDLRFVGVNGPRWLLRALFQGQAAVDPAAAPQLLECLHGVVVNRGGEAMPVRESLPLRLPREIADQARQQAGDEPGDGEESGPGPVPRARPRSKR